MRVLLLLMVCTIFSFANQYTFMVKPYTKELELEAKIIAKIAAQSVGDEVRIFIPEMTQSEESVYKEHFRVVQDCRKANFIFIKRGAKIDEVCKNKERLFFTNNYRKLLSDTTFFGAFFWNKSRPNIVFIKERLKSYSVSLPKEYEKFVEDF
ncbi:MAG: hypothetical protein AB7D43_12890 [Sulfurimonadaceae bacterium]